MLVIGSQVKFVLRFNDTNALSFDSVRLLSAEQFDRIGFYLRSTVDTHRAGAGRTNAWSVNYRGRCVAGVLTADGEGGSDLQ